MKQIKAVLFDWDGTLVNSLDVKIRNAGILFNQVFNLSSDQVEKAYRRHSGIPRRQLFDAILKDNGKTALNDKDFESLSNAFSKKNTEALKDANLPGLIPPSTMIVLQSLQEIGCLLFVSSSAVTEELQEIAASLGLEKFFSSSGGEIMGSRPGFNKGQQHVNYVCEKYGLTRDEMIFVGDDLSDIRLGHEAGVTTFAKVGTHTAEILQSNNADGIIQSLDEITSQPDLKFQGFFKKEN